MDVEKNLIKSASVEVKGKVRQAIIYSLKAVRERSIRERKSVEAHYRNDMDK